MSLPAAEVARDCSAVGHTECGSALGLKLLLGDSSIEGDGYLCIQDETQQHVGPDVPWDECISSLIRTWLWHVN